MNIPSWLTEMHRQWQRTRGKRIGSSSRSFTRDWHKLLTDSGIVTAEDIATAERELETFENQSRLVVHRHRYRRHNIEKISLPLVNEAWWISLFDRTPATELLTRSLAILSDFSLKPHPVFPNEWKKLLAALRIEFTAGKSPYPFKWMEPDKLHEILTICLHLTSREWEPGTLIRAASVAIGLDSKALEKRKPSIEAALSTLLGERLELKSLGLADGDTHVELSGRFTLHFPDGSHQEIDNLHIAKIDTSDIFRCERISTPATELLTIENRKTTFRQHAAANRDGTKLIATTSFPTPTFREFLRKLPKGITHRHFGDTDPAGWHILLKLREATPRPVHAHRMHWRPGKMPTPLGTYDLGILPKLLDSPLLEDVRQEIAAILLHNDKGDYEQETLPVAGTCSPSPS